jgi:adsorption protein B
LLDAGFTAGDWFMLVRHEAVLFVATFFLIGALDEIAVDLTYLWMRATGRARTPRIDDAALLGTPLAGHCAVFIPAWREDGVIGATVAHALAVWPQPELRLYVGCYRNDPATLVAAMKGGGGDRRLRIVVHDAVGPTCKADCLNRLYGALREDEVRQGFTARMVVLHDAEDMVDPAALPLLDNALYHADFAQLPVIALAQPGSRWIAGHYSDEFAEAHAKAMVVRSSLGAGIPGAGVGCAIARECLDRLNRQNRSTGPFAVGSLTEDYELGLQVAALGARARFLRVRSEDGRLIGTRAYFPSELKAAVRQKARWIHGIALQSWDRLGWRGTPVALWMQLRDRRGPLAALLLATAYLLVCVAALEFALHWTGLAEPAPLSAGLLALLWANFAALIWRVGARVAFTAREFGLAEGLRAAPRIVVSNTIAIIAGRRAFMAYARSLRGAITAWDKTEHRQHPALAGLGPSGHAG